jgi:hypothetical protein
MQITNIEAPIAIEEVETYEARLTALTGHVVVTKRPAKAWHCMGV